MAFKLKGGSEINVEELENRMAERRKPINELTSIRRKLMDINLDEQEYNVCQQRYEKTFSEILEELSTLAAAARKLKKKENVVLLENELEKLDNQNEKINAIIYERSKRDDKLTVSSIRNEESVSREKTILPKLQKLELPKFGGVVTEYSRWRKTFETCVDNTSLPEIYKQLQLSHCLYGEPKKLIESFDLSEKGYKAALEKLEDHYGGEQRCYAALMTEVMCFKQIQEDDIIGLDEFVSLVNGITVRLQNLRRDEELGGGLLYQSLLEKLPESIILLWERKIVEKKIGRTVEELKSYIEKEAKVRRSTIERVRGINVFNPPRENPVRNENRSEIAQMMNKVDQKIERRTNLPYNLPQIKRYEHPRKFQQTFYTEKKSNQNKIQNSNRPENRKREKLRNENENQNCWDFEKNGSCKFGQNCRYSHTETKKGKMPICRYYQNGSCKFGEDCKFKHENSPPKNVSREGTTLFTIQKEENGKKEEDEISEIKASSYIIQETTKEETGTDRIALRTVDVWLANGQTEIKVCMLLDDASTESFIKSSVADYLKLNGKEENVSVTVLGGKISRSKVERSKMVLKSKNGKINMPFEALVIQNPTGKMMAVNWEVEKSRWPHLKEIKFASQKAPKSVDGIIGANYIHLHKSIKEIAGKAGEPIARLTPLGWTCVGVINNEKRKAKVNMVRTFGTRTEETQDDRNRLWDVEHKFQEKIEKKLDNQLVENKKLRDLLEENKSRTIRLETDINDSQNKIIELNNDIQIKNTEAQKESRKKEKIEKELKLIKAEVEAKTEEIRNMTSSTEELKQELKAKDDDVFRLKGDLEQAQRQFAVADTRLKEQQKKLDAQVEIANNLKQENQNKAMGLKNREDEVMKNEIQNEIQKKTKLKEATTKKLRSVEDKKAEIDRDRDQLRSEINHLNSEVDNVKKQEEEDKRKSEELKKERDKLTRTSKKAADQTNKQVELVKMHETLKRNLEQEIQNYKEEAQKQRKIIFQLEKVWKKLELVPDRVDSKGREMLNPNQ